MQFFPKGKHTNTWSCLIQNQNIGQFKSVLSTLTGSCSPGSQLRFSASQGSSLRLFSCQTDAQPFNQCLIFRKVHKSSFHNLQSIIQGPYQWEHELSTILLRGQLSFCVERSKVLICSVHIVLVYATWPLFTQHGAHAYQKNHVQCMVPLHTVVGLTVHLTITS